MTGSAMGYAVHIERKSGDEISFQEWKDAVEKHPLVRLSQETTQSVVNQETGQQIGTKTTPGDAEIWIEETETWTYALRWRQGRISINAPRDFDDENSFARRLLRELAAELRASIYGDEGEEYP